MVSNSLQTGGGGTTDLPYICDDIFAKMTPDKITSLFALSRFKAMFEMLLKKTAKNVRGVAKLQLARCML